MFYFFFQPCFVYVKLIIKKERVCLSFLSNIKVMQAFLEAIQECDFFMYKISKKWLKQILESNKLYCLNY